MQISYDPITTSLRNQNKAINKGTRKIKQHSFLRNYANLVFVKVI